MKRLTHARPFALLLLPLVALGCGGHRGNRNQAAVPVYREIEPNDGVLEANDFGVLRPGDFFYIDGFTSDLGFDPFDGFAFTSAEPIHVDFRLFHADQRDDFDVCLYDPFLDETIACYATEARPETGGVDVTAGGIEFHLVVESFFGEGGYSLEIAVSRLFVREAEGGVLDGERASLRASEADASVRLPRAHDDYRLERLEEDDTPGARELSVTIWSVDEETGALVEEVRIERARE